MPRVSIVVPVLDDEPQLRRLLPSIAAEPGVEIIVVDGGPPTAAMAALERDAPGVTWLSSPPGRGVQMNVGAGAATGEWLLFLHADTRLPAGWLGEIDRAASGGAVGGSFAFGLDSASRWARTIERGVRLRVRWLDLPYGDQALFVRRDVFVALRGYRDMPLMEDVDFVRRLRSKGTLYHSALPVATSARRWETDGWLRRSSENVLLTTLYMMGTPPGWLAAIYHRRARARARRRARSTTADA